MNNLGIEIYGFSGKIGTGKNYVAEQIFAKMMLTEKTAVLAYADQLKIDGIVKDGLDRDKCFIKKDEKTRRALQKRGTEDGRDIYGEDLWINYMREWILIHAGRGIKRIIVSDVRFKNEFDLIKEEFGGKVIRVNAPKRNFSKLSQEAKENGVSIESLSSHRSETELDSGRKFDYTILNDPEDNAVLQVREIIKDIQEKEKNDLVIFCDVDDTICHCGIYYESIINEVRDLIWGCLNVKIDKKFFEEKFCESFKRKDGGYYKVFFEKERFPKSLTATVDEFAPYIYERELESLKERAYDLGMSVFDVEYEEMPNRISELRQLQKIGKIVLFTMGDRLEQTKKIVQLGIQDLDYEIFDFKDETIFRNLVHKYPAKKHVMVGDSFERDVISASKAGIDYPVLITSRNHTFVDSEIEKNNEYYVISSLSEINTLLINMQDD